MGKLKNRPYRALTRCVFAWATLLNVATGPFATASEPVPVVPDSKLQPSPDLASQASPWHTLLTSEGTLSLQLFSSSAERSSYQPAAATPSVLMRGSSVAAASRSNDAGTTTFTRLREGTHSFIAVGPSGFCSIGLLLAHPEKTGPGSPLTLQEVALVPVTDGPVIRELISKQSVSKTTPIGNLLSLDEFDTANSHQLPQFVMQSDGTIQGRLTRVERAGVRAIPELNVAFIRNQAVVAKATSNDQGVFRCSSPSLHPGMISVVAYGSQGYAAFGAEIIESTETADRTLQFDGTVQVAFQTPTVVNSPTISLADPASMNAFTQSIAPAPGPGAGAAGGGAGAGAASGGGAGGGGGGAAGGAGGALGIAGLAAGVTAAGIAASNNDSPPPASPATP